MVIVLLIMVLYIGFFNFRFILNMVGLVILLRYVVIVDESVKVFNCLFLVFKLIVNDVVVCDMFEYKVIIWIIGLNFCVVINWILIGLSVLWILIEINYGYVVVSSGIVIKLVLLYKNMFIFVIFIEIKLVIGLRIIKVSGVVINMISIGFVKILIMFGVIFFINFLI